MLNIQKTTNRFMRKVKNLFSNEYWLLLEIQYPDVINANAENNT